MAESDGDRDTVGTADGVLKADDDGDALGLGETDGPVPLREGGEGETLREGLSALVEGETLPVPEGERETLLVAEGERETLGDSECDHERLQLERLPDALAVLLVELLGDGLCAEWLLDSLDDGVIVADDVAADPVAAKSSARERMTHLSTMLFCSYGRVPQRLK